MDRLCGEIYENANASRSRPDPRASVAPARPSASQADPEEPEAEADESASGVAVGEDGEQGGQEEEEDEEYDRGGNEYVFSVDVRRRFVAALRDLMEAFQILEISHRREFSISSTAKGDSAVCVILEFSCSSLTHR